MNKMDKTIENIRQYLRENPTHTGANIARKFKICVDMADNYYHYCRLLDDPEADMPIYHIVNYTEFKRKQLEEETKKEILERKKRIEKNYRLVNDNPNSVIGVNL